MSKITVPNVTNEKYHIYNRGVDKRDVFMDKFDYLRFYQTLHLFNCVEPTQNYRLAKNSHESTKQLLVRIHAYSLLKNHFHLIIEQVCDNGISEFMKRIGGGYTNFFNEKYNRSGALFQGKYKKVHIENDNQYNYLFAYVNENHFVHGARPTNDICYTSSLHYQKTFNSSLIKFEDIKYEHTEARKLAQDIFEKRKEFKDTLE